MSRCGWYTCSSRRMFPGPRFAKRDAPLPVRRCMSPVGLSRRPGNSVKIESEVLRGKPLTELMEQSRSAAMICVGSIGLNHAHNGVGSVSAALAASALCPVAVIQRPVGQPATPTISRVVVQADNGAALNHAFEEARLRQAPLRAIAVSPAGGPDDAGEKRLAQAQLSRRIARWTRLYPDVQVECASYVGASTGIWPPTTSRISCSSPTQVHASTSAAGTTRDAPFLPCGPGTCEDLPDRGRAHW